GIQFLNDRLQDKVAAVPIQQHDPMHALGLQEGDEVADHLCERLWLNPDRAGRRSVTFAHAEWQRWYPVRVQPCGDATRKLLNPEKVCADGQMRTVLFDRTDRN